MNTNPDDLAFPAVRPTNMGNGVVAYNLYPGLSKREYMACLIMAGFATRTHHLIDHSVEVKARDAVRQADALIQALNATDEGTG
jgi:hypothetical protein